MFEQDHEPIEGGMIIFLREGCEMIMIMMMMMMMVIIIEGAGGVIVMVVMIMVVEDIVILRPIAEEGDVMEITMKMTDMDEEGTMMIIVVMVIRDIWMIVLW